MLLSICVLTFNRCNFLEQLLNSIASSGILQNDQVELIVMNNGSSDETQDFLEKFSNSNRVKVVSSETNSRGSVAYEKLLFHAQGKWAIAPGDDDIFYEKTLAVLPDMLNSIPEDVSLVPFGATTINEFGKGTPIKFEPTEERNSAKLMGKLLRESIFWFPSTCFRKSIITENQIPKTITVFDWWIWIQGVIVGKTSPQRENLIKYRIHSGQEQHTFNNAAWQLDYAETFSYILSSEKYRNWLQGLSQTDLLNLFEEISNKNPELLTDVESFILLKLGIVICETNPDLKEKAMTFLVSVGIDARFAAIHTGLQLNREILGEALNRITKSNDEQWKLKTYQELETQINVLMMSIRNKEIQQTITPFERRLIRYYRKLRFNKFSRVIFKR